MMPTKQALVSVERIDRLIYAVRGQRVMLDRDLAMLYDVETRPYAATGKDSPPISCWN